MTDFLERLDKAQARLSKMKHIDGVDLGLNHIIPLIRECYLEATDAIVEVDERIDNIEQGLFGQHATAVLSEAHSTIAELAALLDSAMEALGEQAPPLLKQNVGGVKVRLTACVTLIQTLLAAFSGESSDSKNDLDGDGENESDDSGEEGTDTDRDGEPTAPGKRREASA